MSCMYDVKQSPVSPVTYMDSFEVVYNALEADVYSGRVVIDPGESQGNVIVFCTETNVTEMPSDISNKLSQAWLKVSFGPYGIETQDRVIEPTDYWRERHPNLVANVS